eukprot:1160053-Pelagomonas_calceolata.AAC.7
MAACPAPGLLRGGPLHAMLALTHSVSDASVNDALHARIHCCVQDTSSARRASMTGILTFSQQPLLPPEVRPPMITYHTTAIASNLKLLRRQTKACTTVTNATCQPCMHLPAHQLTPAA